MAKAKKKGGESNVGLVVTLVLFILTTIGLGVATYYGFSEQASLQEAAKKATTEAKQTEERLKAYRAQGNILRDYIGDATANADALAEAAQEKATIDSGGKALSSGEKNFDEFKKLLAKLDSTMKWDAKKDKVPTITFETRLREKDNAYNALLQRVTALQTQLTDSQAKATALEGQLADEKKAHAAAQATLRQQADADQVNNRKAIADLRVAVETKSKEKEEESNGKDNALKQLATVTSLKTKLEGDLTTLKKEKRELQDILEETKGLLSALYAKSGVDPKVLEAEALDAKAQQVLKNWKKDWRIVMMDRTGKEPYISLRTSDKVTPQLTFSIHGKGPDGRLNPTPKGTLEIVEVRPDVSRARITSVRDPRTDPILAGDMLFNPTWDPNLRKHLAVVGLIDLAGDGHDSTAEFLRMLEKQGVVVDYYLDMKELKIKGKGIDVNTDYVVIGESLDNGVDPRGRDRDLVQKVDREIRKAKDLALANGVTILGFRKYLDMIGYRSPRIVTPAASSYGVK